MSNKNDPREKQPPKQGKNRTREDGHGSRYRSGSSGGIDVDWPTAISAAAGILAAWVAADSTGLLVAPLRQALTVFLLGVMLVVLRPTWRRLAAIVLAVAVALLAGRLADGSPAVDVLAVSAVLALIAATARRQRRVWSIVATAAAVLALFRAACFTVPMVWTLDEILGLGMGRAARLFGGRSLWLGGAMGGLDLIVLMAVFYAGWLRATHPPRRARAVYAAVAIVAVQIVYLVGLSYAIDIAQALPEQPMPESLQAHEYRPTDWNVAAELRDALPWNMPFLAALLQAGVAVAMLRWTRIEPDDVETHAADSSTGSSTGESTGKGECEPDSRLSLAATGRFARWILPAAIVVAAATVLLSSWSSNAGDLSGKTVLAWREGYVDWNVPEHDALGTHQTGTYGLLPSLVGSLGGKWLISDDLSEEELKQADVVLIIHPVADLPEDMLERIEKYVREGGSLLVATNPMVENEVSPRIAATRAAAVGDHSSPDLAASIDEDAMLGANLRPVNRLLRPTGMAFRHDEAFAPTRSWAGALSPSTHPAVFGLADRTLALGLRKSGSIEMSCLARPILTGRWGWSEPGGDRFYSGYVEPNAGDKWGDLVLAAERPLGGGTVVAIADTWSLTNLGMADGHEMAGRLLSYLAHRPSNPQAMWRQLAALAGYAVLVVLVVRRPNPWRTVAIVSTAALTLSILTLDARAKGPTPGVAGASTDTSEPGAARPIAYVDASHLEIGNDRVWANDGIDGFLLTLARDGYLPLKLHRWDRARLDRASLLVIMAPRRPFSAGEIGDLREFVNRGGNVVCMVGATEAAGTRTLLDAFEFTLDPSPSPTGSKVAEAEPMGYFPENFGSFFAMYLLASESGRDARVLVSSGWPIGCSADNWEVLMQGYDGHALMIRTMLGRGQIILIGDSRFALNQNHGYYNGEPLETVEDNANFWRWLLSKVKGGPTWMPPDPRSQNRQTRVLNRGEVMR